jgi:hypothetical protein
VRKLSREELIALVQRIMDSDGSEEEVDEMISLLQASVPHPEVTDLIFWPKHGEPSAEDVVDAALAYKPIQL